MKTYFSILYFSLMLLSYPVLADLSIDQGASWLYISEQSVRCANQDSERCRLYSWISLGDESYRIGNYNEALERYENSLALNPDSNDQAIINNHIGDVFLNSAGMMKLLINMKKFKQLDI